MMKSREIERARLWSISDGQAGARADMEASFVAMLIRLWGRRLGERFGTMLNVPCGLGRHDRTLREEGFTVFGADIDRGFIGVARERNPSFWDSYVVADMRKLPYRKGRFDAVVNLFTAFGYFDDKGNARALRELARVVRPGGLVVIETHNAASAKDGMMPLFMEGLGNGAFRMVENIVEGNTWVLKSTLLKDGGKMMLKGKTQVTRVRLYSKKELEGLCEGVGLEVLAAYGGYTISPLRDRDTLMLLVARKLGPRPGRGRA